MTEKRKFTFETIGHIENSFKYHYEAPRQAVFAAAGAFLRWDSGEYAAAAEDLAGFDRIWLIWVFDQNKHSSWRTKVQVPVPAEKDQNEAEPRGSDPGAFAAVYFPRACDLAVHIRY